MQQLDASQIKEIIKELENYRILILPTDTIYGFSALFEPLMGQKINEVKHAPLDKTLIVLVADLAMAKNLVSGGEKDFDLLLDPQPTTVIFKSRSDETKTIALRIVKRDDLKTIIQEVGPIFSTSVNLHGQPVLRTEEELTNFNPQIKTYFVGELNASPSRIYNSLEEKFIR